MAENILTPVGRLVAGSPFEGQTKKLDGTPATTKDGQPKTTYFMALAIPKNDPHWSALQNIIFGEARKSFPNLFNPQGQCLRPDFAFKITDGDSQVPNQNNRRPCDKEGYSGHWVLNFSTSIPPKVYTKGGTALVTDKAQIKCGDYVRIFGYVAGNDQAQKPGVYLNPSMVEHCGYGTEIVSGPAADAVFGAAPAILPPGASATPLAPAVSALPVMQSPAPVGFAAPSAPAFLPPVPAPAHDFVNPEFYTLNGNRYAKADLLKVGWTEAQIATLPRA